MTSTAETPPSEARAARPAPLAHVVSIAAAAAMGGFLFGYDSSVINGAVEAVRDRATTSVRRCWPRSSPSR